MKHSWRRNERNHQTIFWSTSLHLISFLSFISKHSCFGVGFLGNGRLVNAPPITMLSWKMKSYFAITSASLLWGTRWPRKSKNFTVRSPVELKILIGIVHWLKDVLVQADIKLTHATMLKQKSVYFTQAILRARRAALSPRESCVPILSMFCVYYSMISFFDEF